MKLGYITKQSPEDIKAYSGIHYYMRQALQKNFSRVEDLGPIRDAYKYIPKAKGRWFRLTGDKVFKYQYDLKLARRASKIIDERIQNLKPDVLLGSLVCPEVAYLESKIPLFITIDATFPLLNDLYASHSNLHPESIKNAKHLESLAFKKAKKLILPLEWVADSAMKDYGVPADKIEVIPYGANIDGSMSPDEFEENLLRKKNSKTCKLLFVGVRWEEKGGPAAVETVRLLRERGVDAELIICGATPDIEGGMDGIRLMGFLDKSDPGQYAKLKDLYKEAHFFLFPTLAECVGISILEATAFALPALTTGVGGMPEAVSDHVNGFISEKPDDAAFYAEQIFRTWQNKEEYERLSRNAFDLYQNKLNWDTWGKKTWEVIGGDTSLRSA